MVYNEFARIFFGVLAEFGVFVGVEEKVVAHATSYEAFLYFGQRINRFVDVEQGLVVCIEVGAYSGTDARGAFAATAYVAVFAVHHVHVGRRTAEVGEVAFESRHLYHLFHFAHDALFGATHDEFSLMCRDGAECASAKASAVEVDGEFYHLVGGNALVLVFGMGQACVGEVEGVVNLFCSHWGKWRIDHYVFFAESLEQALGVELVAFFFDVSEIFGVVFAVCEAVFVGVENDVVFAESVWNFFGGHDGHGLPYGVFVEYGAELLCGAEGIVASVEEFVLKRAAEFRHGHLSHAVDDEVGLAFVENARTKFLLPVVVMRDAAQRGFNSAEHDGGVGKCLSENFGVDNGRKVGTHVVPPVGAVGVFGAESSVGGVLVDHGIHGSGRDAEEEARASEFFEVAEVAVPVGLRYDAYAQSFVFKETAYDGGAK